MHYFRRLPVLLRVIGILGLLFILTAVALYLGAVITDPAVLDRVFLIGLNLLSLSLACTFVVNTYGVRFRRVGLASYPLESWQSQVRWWGLLAALPLGVLLVVVLLPWSPLVEIVLGLPTLLALLTLGAAFIYAQIKWPGLT